MKIVYTNLSPINNAYTNLNHIFHLKKQNPQKAYICVWDSFVFEHPIFTKNFDSAKNRAEKLSENVEIIEKIMSYLEIDYKIIYLSEAMKRLFKSSEHFSEFQNILSNIKIGDLTKGSNLAYTPFNEISLSRMNYIISDYLISTYLPELFPEICSSQPTHYLTSERFKVFQGELNHSIRSKLSRYVPPKSVFVTNVPVIMHPEDKVIPSMEMSLESIKRIVKAHYKKKPNKKEMYDVTEVLYNVLNELSHKDEKIKKSKIENFIEKVSYNDFIDFVSLNLYNYFEDIGKITAKIEINSQKRSMFISTYKDFIKQIKPLSNIKLEILKHCNGNNSSLDISRKTGLKLSTVSTYLTHLKIKKIIDDDRRPKRLIDSFVIDLEVIEK